VWWGDYHHGLQRQRGVVTYGTLGFPQLVELRLKVSSSGVSPFRQSATSHMFRSYLFNGYRRLAAQLPYWVIPVGIGGLFVMSLSHLLTDINCAGYSVYAWAKKRDAWQNSKAGHLAGASH
jgi:ubiquinol-cytochrome c reductase subunit 8